MENLSLNEVYQRHEFVMEIEGIESPNITKVSGLGKGEMEAIEQPSGSTNITQKINSGIIKNRELTLERNIDGSKADKDFRDWFKQMFNLDGRGMGSKLRRHGFIVAKEHRQEVQRFVFEGGWIKSSKFSDLDAAASGLLKQTIVMAVERLYRV